MAILNRRQFLITTGSLVLASFPNTLVRATGNLAPGIAFTIDDFSWAADPLHTAYERDVAIRQALSEFNVQAGAFPKAQIIDTTNAGSGLWMWANEGHIIGNHTYSHPYYGGDDPSAMMDEVVKAEAVLSRYPTYRKWLRFPYLAEGKTEEGRDGLRSLLARHNYINAHVTIDTSDWYINKHLQDRLRDDPDTDVSPYREYYLEHLWDRANYYNDLAIDLTGRRDIPHTILLHHNLAAALFLRDAIVMFKERGWRLVDIEAAYEDQLYRQSPNSLPAGQSLIWAMAKASGRYEDQLRYPGEGQKYEMSGLDALKEKRAGSIER